MIVILSPHPDDAVLSLWHVLTGPDDVQVLTVFNGPGEGSPELGWWDRLTRAESPAERARERAAEDREALGMAGRKPVDLGFVDGQYRQVAQAVEPLAEAIAAAVPADALLLAPAALDGHRDHVATRDAALALAASGRPVSLYADVPHANLHGWPAWVTGAEPDPYLDPEVFWGLGMNGAGIVLGESNAQVHRLGDDDDTRKRDAVGRYRTQVAALEAEFGVFARPDILRYEVLWSLGAADR
jgi:LmbE family N-acetylglucosaminyl deacetylase